MHTGHSEKRFTLCLHTLLSFAVLFLLTMSVSRPVPADDMIVADPSGSDTSFDPEAMTETEPLLETEAVYEVPAGLTDNLKKDTPVGEAARMTDGERRAFVTRMYLANSAQELWKRHDNVSAAFRLFDKESQMWKEYCCSYADRSLSYYDDWTPGIEELRLLIRGENDCVEDYTISKRFVRFLNASGQPYRRPMSDPVTLSRDTPDESLLMIREADGVLAVVTQLTDPSIIRLGLESDYDSESGAAKDGSFYSCTYLLDPETLDVLMMQICLHTAGENTGSDTCTVDDLRNISYSYDHGMTPFVETGLTGLLRHMEPEKIWEMHNLRTVSVTLVPGESAGQVYSLAALKGDPVSFSLPDGYELYVDEALTTRWVDNGDYVSDLALWAANCTK